MGDLVDSVVGGISSIFGGSDAPDAPDPYATANAQYTANTDAARLSALLSRFSQKTPTGSLTWEQDKDNPDIWTMIQTLTKDQQSLLDKGEQGALSTADILNQLLTSGKGTLSDTMSIPDWNLSTPAAPETSRASIINAIYDQMTSRLDPQYQQYQDRLESKLANQGITQGSEAWGTEMENFGRARNDAYQNALNSSITQGQDAYYGVRDQTLQERAQQIGENSGARNQILNELNALRTGSQVTNPQFTGQQTGVDIGAAPIAQSIYNGYEGEIANYNADVSSQNALINGMASLGSAWLMKGK